MSIEPAQSTCPRRRSRRSLWARCWECPTWAARSACSSSSAWRPPSPWCPGRGTPRASSPAGPAGRLHHRYNRPEANPEIGQVGRFFGNTLDSHPWEEAVQLPENTSANHKEEIVHDGKVDHYQPMIVVVLSENESNNWVKQYEPTIIDYCVYQLKLKVDRMVENWSSPSVKDKISAEPSPKQSWSLLVALCIVSFIPKDICNQTFKTRTDQFDSRNPCLMMVC